MIENQNCEFATPKKITTELIWGYILWGIIFGLIGKLIGVGVDYITEMTTLSHMSSVGILLITLIISYVFECLIWRGSVKSTFKKRTMASTDIPKVTKNIAIFITIMMVISLVSSCYEIKGLVEPLKTYENLLENYGAYYEQSGLLEVENAYKEAKTLIYTTCALLIVEDIFTGLPILILIKKMLLKKAQPIEDETNNIVLQRNVSTFTMSLIILGGLILVSTLIIAIIAVSVKGIGGSENAANNLPDSFEKMTLEDVKIMANNALDEAKNNSQLFSNEDYYNYVIDSMKKEGINVDKYNIIVSELGVLVSEKSESSNTDNQGGLEESVPDTEEKTDETEKDEDKDDLPSVPSTSSKGYVYDAEYEYDVSKTSYTTNYNKTFYVKDIVVPYINIDSPDAKAANSEIKSLFDRAIATYKNGIQDHTSGVEACSYKYSHKGNILSVQFVLSTCGTGVGRPEYYIYNFNTDTGEALTYKNVYMAPGFIDNDVDFYVSLAISKYVKNKLYNASFPEGESVATYINASVTNYETAKKNGTLKYYVDENGKLNVLIKIKLPVGNGAVDTIITVDKSELNSIVPEYGTLVNALGSAYADLKAGAPGATRSINISTSEAIEKYNLVFEKYGGSLTSEKLSEQNKVVTCVLGKNEDKANVTFKLMNNGTYTLDVAYKYQKVTNLTNLLEKITPLSDFNNVSLNENDVEELIYNSICGNFSYPLTVRYGKSDKDVVVITAGNVGYECGELAETMQSFTYNTPYVKEGTKIRGFSQTTTSRYLTGGQKINDVIIDGNYTAVVIKSSKNAELGLYIYIEQ